MLPTHQRVRKGVFFWNVNGFHKSRTPEAYYFILYYFIFLKVMWLCWCACKSSSLRLDINSINNHNGNNGATAPPSRWQQQQQHQQQHYPTTQGSTQRQRYGMGDRDVVAEKWGSRRNKSRAPGTFFFLYFFHYSYFYFCLELRVWPPLFYHHYTMRKGPNDASCVVWSLGEFYFISFVFFLVLNDIHRYYILSKSPEGFSTVNYGDNGPNSKFFFFFPSFLHNYSI